MTRSGDYSLSTHGSLAYNFQPIGNENPGAYGMLPQKEKKHSFLADRNTSPAMAAALLLCAVLIFVSLLFRSSLVLISEETLALQNEISELREQQIGLKIRHAEVFSLEETEKYAVEVLGMKKPGVDQIRYVDFPNWTDELPSEEH